MKKQPACGTCKFYAEGACKRFPPARVYTGDTRVKPDAIDVTVWPVVAGDNWCGEYSKRKK